MEGLEGSLEFTVLFGEGVNDTGNALWDEPANRTGGVFSTFAVNFVIATMALGFLGCFRQIFFDFFHPFFIGAREMSYGPCPRADEARRMRYPFAWIWMTILTPLSVVRKRSGTFAYSYLLFQRGQVVFMFFLMIFCCCVILPTCILGEEVGKISDPSFAITTISNIPLDSPWLWASVVGSLVVSVLVLGFAWSYLVGSLFIFHQRKPFGAVGLRLTGIPKSCSRDRMFAAFAEATRTIGNGSIHPIYDLRKTQKLFEERKRNAYRLQELMDAPGRRIDDDAPGSVIHNLQSKLRSIEDKLAEELKKVELKGFSGEAFACFESHADAMRFKKELKLVDVTQFEKEKPRSWKVSVHRQGDPKDVVWKSLFKGKVRRYAVRALVFVFWTLYVVFMTSPTTLWSTGNKWLHLSDILPNEDSAWWAPLNSILFELVPVMLFFLLVALIPIGLRYSSDFEGWRNRSSGDVSLFSKVFAFFYLSIIVVPSLQLVTLDAILQQFLNKDEDLVVQLGHVFLANSGSFFVNYMINITFIAIAFENLRIVPFVMYVFQVIKARIRGATKLEKRMLCISVQHEFDFPVQLAYSLSVFLLVVLYAVPIPVITIVGFLFFVHRHVIDSFYLLYVHPATGLKSSICMDVSEERVQVNGGEDKETEVSIPSETAGYPLRYRKGKWGGEGACPCALESANRPRQWRNWPNHSPTNAGIVSLAFVGILLGLLVQQVFWFCFWLFRQSWYKLAAIVPFFLTPFVIVSCVFGSRRLRGVLTTLIALATGHEVMKEVTHQVDEGREEDERIETSGPDYQALESVSDEQLSGEIVDEDVRYSRAPYSWADRIQELFGPFHPADRLGQQPAVEIRKEPDKMDDAQ